MRRRRLLQLLIFAVAAGAVLWLGVPHLPDRWNPWAPIRLADAPNLLTGWKLRRLDEAPALCHALLDRAGFAWRAVPDRETGEACGFSNAVRISGGDVAYGSSFVASCPLAVGLALFERHTLQPAARAAFGREVAAIEHFGTYACRNVNNRQVGRRSQHATANAIDIAGFRLADGTGISVLRDWRGGGPRAGFLHDVRAGACRIFNVVLGPDYNTAHSDHLHLDMGFFSTCRRRPRQRGRAARKHGQD